MSNDLGAKDSVRNPVLVCWHVIKTGRLPFPSYMTPHFAAWYKWPIVVEGGDLYENENMYDYEHSQKSNESFEFLVNASPPYKPGAQAHIPHTAALN